MTSVANLHIDQNTKYENQIHFEDDGEVVDVSNFTFIGQIRKLYSSTSMAEFEFYYEEAADGIIQLELPTNNGLVPGKYRYDILLQYENGDREKVLEGLVTVYETVTS